MKFYRIVLATALFAAAVPAAAEDYQVRVNDLVTISSVFGELHHIRRTCAPQREGQIWRDRMRKLIDLEVPQSAVRERMVAAFNTGYRGAQDRYRYCDREARDYAAARAAAGDTVINRLMAPLYTSVGETGELPTVWRGGENQ
ncbi:MAG: TIGR02301 family protein [Pseudomonadota bacterium]